MIAWGRSPDGAMIGVFPDADGNMVDLTDRKRGETRQLIIGAADSVVILTPNMAIRLAEYLTHWSKGGVLGPIP